jgi:hypothetical protein
MKSDLATICIAFDGSKKITSGTLLEVAGKVKQYLQKESEASVLIFDSQSSAPIEINFRGSMENVLKRLKEETGAESSSKPAGPGRPKLGVVSREVSLLPRHWDWLALQPGGASNALRRLVEEAKKQNVEKDRVRQSQEATYKFMHSMAGNLKHYEEAMRALYVKNKSLFETLIHDWPKDIRHHIKALAGPAFDGESV